ncbi:MAG TPA: XrtA-associated tyrosine autokinase [Rhodocyclaceae bacterium]|nr:XrtA-associated tyrosine autokinase [Rhodocyclaceae bacterium]
MSSLIEQAAKRLAQLKKAGVELPETPAPQQVQAEAPAAPPPRGSAQPSSASNEPAATSRKVDLDLLAIAASGIVTPNAPRSAIADEYRIIKRPLISNALGKGAAPIAKGNLIMITSALPGEGKSFTSINLAMSMAAEMDTTVMLVDADVARPSILSTLGLPPARGLLDVLVNDSVDLSDVLLKTNIDKLTILPSGTRQERATELLASDAMARLLDDMASRYADRIIIFDSPPLLLTTEARELARHMGQVVLVVKAEETLQADVRHALATIVDCPVKLMMLNQARSGKGVGYGYAYGYGYGEQI